MKHTKFVSMLMAIVMLMGVLTVPASAANTIDINIPGAAGGSPTDSSESMASVDDNFKTFCEYRAKATGCKDIIDYENLTIEYADKDGNPFGGKSIWNRTTREITHYDANGNEVFAIDAYVENPFANIKSVESTQQEITVNTQSITEPAETEPKTEVKPEAKHFADVPDNAWYAEAVNTLAANGILNGYDDGLFHPENTITIGELSVIVYRLATGEDPVGKTGSYPDIEGHPAFGRYDHWAAYAHEALWSRNAGYVLKWTNRIDEPATRGDAINTVYMLTAGVKGLNNMTVIPEWDFTWDGWNPDMLQGRNSQYYTEAELQEKSGIPDIKLDPSLNYSQAMDIIQGIMLAYKYGIVSGIDEKGSCNNLANITRAELCQMLYNAGMTEFTTQAYWKVSPSYGSIIVY